MCARVFKAYGSALHDVKQYRVSFIRVARHAVSRIRASQGGRASQVKTTTIVLVDTLFYQFTIFCYTVYVCKFYAKRWETLGQNPETREKLNTNTTTVVTSREDKIIRTTDLLCAIHTIRRNKNIV